MKAFLFVAPNTLVAVVAAVKWFGTSGTPAQLTVHVTPEVIQATVPIMTTRCCFKKTQPLQLFAVPRLQVESYQLNNFSFSWHKRYFNSVNVQHIDTFKIVEKLTSSSRTMTIFPHCLQEAKTNYQNNKNCEANISYVSQHNGSEKKATYRNSKCINREEMVTKW